MNKKHDKVELLKSIQSGEVKPDQLTSESKIVSESKEAFTGLMANVASKRTGKRPRILFVGEAQKAINQTTENLKANRNENRS
jgi:hypothetical protein